MVALKETLKQELMVTASLDGCTYGGSMDLISVGCVSSTSMDHGISDSFVQGQLARQP